jgi:hypothetical protein
MVDVLSDYAINRVGDRVWRTKVHPSPVQEVVTKRIEQRSRDILAIGPSVTIVPFGPLPHRSGKTKLIETA